MDGKQKIGETLERALGHHRAGRLDEAEALYRRLVEDRPENADAWHLLGLVAHARGDLAAALALVERAIDGNAAAAIFHNSHGQILYELDRTADALVAFDAALDRKADYAEAHNNRGNALLRAGRDTEALTAYDRALEIAPGYGEAHYNRGNLLRHQGQAEQALAAYDKALQANPALVPAHFERCVLLEKMARAEDALDGYGALLRLHPDYAEALTNRGNVLRGLKRPDEALQDYDQALAASPTLAEAYNNRGTVLRDLGRIDDALADFDAAIDLKPDYPEAHSNRGVVLRDLGRPADALATLDRAVAAAPDNAEAHCNRAAVLRDLGRPDDAFAAIETAIRLEPDYADAHNNMGSIRKDQGRIGEALASYKDALRCDPDFAQARSNYLFCLNYDPVIGDDDLLAAHREWGDRHGHPDNAYADHPNSADPDRTLRVGLVSGDFLRHPVGYFLDPVLRHLDPARVEIYCYSNRAKGDDLTKKLEERAKRWRLVVGLSDRQMAEAIRADGIDILIDLSGHTAGNRLCCFALKPAPVQATWLGYCHTTGLPAIDYILADSSFAPAGDERWFTEKIVRLPYIRWCFGPPDYAPEVAEPPALEAGHVTFASFNNLTKLNLEVVALWARVLKKIPESRLLLSWRTLAQAAERKRIVALFNMRGIGAERLAFSAGADNHAGVLAQYARADIALDPFPFAGGLSTCEALWMGMPVVTLPQTRPVSRQSVGMLAAVGHDDWVAANADDYVRIAAELAADPERLATLRRAQRGRMAASPLCDGPLFATDLEAALRGMWRAWTTERPPGNL